MGIAVIQLGLKLVGKIEDHRPPEEAVREIPRVGHMIGAHPEGGEGLHIERVL